MKKFFVFLFYLMMFVELFGIVLFSNLKSNTHCPSCNGYVIFFGVMFVASVVLVLIKKCSDAEEEVTYKEMPKVSKPEVKEGLDMDDNLPKE